MTIITYEEKMEFLDNLLMRGKLLHETCEGCFPQKDIEILECIIEDVRDFKIVLEQSKENYKHWNLFYNGKTGQHLLYLYKDRKSDMLEIGQDLYEIIKEKVGS